MKNNLHSMIWVLLPILTLIKVKGIKLYKGSQFRFFYGILRSSANLLIFLILWSAGISISPAQNLIVTENSKPGNPASEWQITGAGDRSIQGFATDISYNKGETARFKIKTNSGAYSIRIFRLGYYQGNGARYQGNATITANLPQSQPNCLTQSSTGLIDCGNWNESASWQIPVTAVSGIYIAKLTRNDTGGSSHITFIVRDDGGNSDLLFQTSDATWQAYNIYGDNNNGKSLYTGAGGKAFKVSYNRPFLTRDGAGGGGPYEDWLFNAEYPMLRWIEANGYDVSYTTNVDSDRRGNLIKNHKVFLSVGHDEYWSGTQRAYVEEARDTGTHLAFFSGNEVYWKTRWETSIDGSGTAFRTLVCYKEGTSGENTCNGKCDPSADWTGLWRTGCEYTTGNPVVDGCNPENSLTGQISWELSDASLQVPGTYRNYRFWRNTSVASLGENQTASFTFGTIGYEWNAEMDLYRSSYPNARILLSRTVINGKTHNISLYKHQSGALVFGAGTVQWSWGLDSNHDRGNAAPSLAMQQATLNLFADMGVQPGSKQSNLVDASASTDFELPVTTISNPKSGDIIPQNVAITISGTATDNQVLAGVEVSFDQGLTWNLATGTSNWTYTWTPTYNGAVNIQSRAFDDSGNIGDPTIVNVQTGEVVVNCPCSVFNPGYEPVRNLENDGQPLQLGMKFNSTVDGFIKGIRFYKQSGTTGQHTGQLYSVTGTLLSEVLFSNETASGWQQAYFSSPVAITANTTYIISYHNSAGFYSVDDRGFDFGISNGPLRGLANGEDGPNGVYRYTATPAFPNSNYLSSNYWVDVIFDTQTGEENSAPAISITSPANNAAFVAPASINITATASDTDGTIAKVEFYNGATRLGEDLSSPYAYSWNNVAEGNYNLTAVATDNKGAKTTSAAIQISVTAAPNQAPAVSITSPANNASFVAPASINITATASDTDGTIAKVEFYNGTTKLGEDLSSPYVYSWGNVASGNYNLTAVATDDKGAKTTSAAVQISVTASPNQAPVVAITSPANNTSFAAPATVNITATASDTDGTITKVEFYNGAIKLGEDLTTPYEYSWNNVAAGNYNLTAVAIDDKGAQSTSGSVNISVSNSTSPAITNVSPGTGPAGTIVIITGTNLSNASKVTFGPGTASIISNTATRLEVTVPSIKGKLPSSVNLTVTTAVGSVTATEKFIVTSGSVPSNSAPQVSITSPSNNSSFAAPANINISATAVDSDGIINKVEFFNGSILLGSDLTTPYEFSWLNVPAGSYSLIARATDDKGAATNSATVVINVTRPNNSAPIVSLTSPAHNSQFNAPATIQISATASDNDGTINKVEFYNGSNILGDDNSSPYTYSWNNVPAGNYSLTAKAIDNEGAASVSTSINIAVSSSNSIAAPSNLMAMLVSNTQVNINWQDNSNNESNFILERAGKADFSGKIDIINLPANTINYQDTNLNNKKGGGVLYYRIKAVNGNLSSEYSTAVMASSMNVNIKSVEDSELDMTSKIMIEEEEIELQASFQILPNPTEGISQIEFVLPASGGYVINLFSTQGSLISKLGEGNALAGEKVSLQFDGRQLANGLYLVKLYHIKGTNTYRLLLAR